MLLGQAFIEMVDAAIGQTQRIPTRGRAPIPQRAHAFQLSKYPLSAAMGKNEFV
jgi:hypothetical protein